MFRPRRIGVTRAGLLRLLVSLALCLLAMPLLANAGEASTDCSASGGFEIDGNTTVNSPGCLDWDSPGVPAPTHDGLQDATGFATGDELNFPAGATIGPVNSGKTDINDVYSYSAVYGGALWAYFGYSRGKSTGSTSVEIELNQQPNSPANSPFPTRTPGDYRVSITQSGNGPYQMDSADRWSGSSWIPASTAGVVSAESTDGSFIEFAFNLTSLTGVQPACPPSESFVTLNLRSRQSNELTSALSDWINPVPFQTPSTCGSLTLVKKVVGGSAVPTDWNLTAHTTGQVPADLATVSGTTGVTGDVVPDQAYALSESGPGGYYPSTWSCVGASVSGPVGAQYVTPVAGKNATCTLTNTALTSLTVQKVDAESGTALDGAHFTLFRDADHNTVFGSGGTVSGSSDDVSEGSCATAGADGTCSVSGLQEGWYYWQETAAPTGYALPTSAYSPIVKVDDSSAGSNVTPTVVRDPRLPTDLTVRKVDDAAPNTPLSGAEFTLYQGTYPGGSMVASPDNPCTTGAAGECTVHGLGFGSYYWVETAAPVGFLLPAKATVEPVTVDASDAGQAPTVTFSDHPASSLRVLKVDAANGNPLAGGVFGLYRGTPPSDPTAAPAGQPLGSCTTGAAGTCAVGGLDYGTYYWAELTSPAGYAAPADPYSAPVTIASANAGGLVSTTTFEDAALASVQVTNSWVINGTSYADGSQPAGYSADLDLTGRSAPAFGTTYTSESSGAPYVQGQSVTIGQTTALPDGCTVSASVPGQQTLGAGANTYAVLNDVTCPATVEVTKTWVIDGTSFANDDPNLPIGFSAMAAITGEQFPAFGTAYANRTDGSPYLLGQQVTVGESDVVVPQGCTDVASGDLGSHQLGIGPNVYSITNKVTCDGTLTLAMNVVNDDGGQAAPTSWTVSATAAGHQTVSGAGQATGTVDPGVSYDLAQTPVADDDTAGYLASAWTCTGATVGTGGEGQPTVTLPYGTSAASCSVTNNDVAPTLRLIKKVAGVNPAPATDWTLDAAGPTTADWTTTSTDGGVTAVSARNAVQSGKYTLSEDPSPGQGYVTNGWSCYNDGMAGSIGSNAGDVLTIGPGAQVTCTIVNTASETTLRLAKHVVNDNGGTAVAADWTLDANGPTQVSVTGVEPTATPGPVPNPVSAGTYTLSETGGAGTSGYALDSLSCVHTGTETAVPTDGDQVRIARGDDVTCTFTNDDIAPRLTLVKYVDNGRSGATAQPTDWTLSATGHGAVGLSGHMPADNMGLSGAVDARVAYKLGEHGPAGYVSGGWSCIGGSMNAAGTTVTLPLAADVTCSVTNTAVRPSLTVQKTDPSGHPLRGAVFELHTGTAPAQARAPRSTLVGSCTTDAAGRCTVAHLRWNTKYYWFEAKAPSGYRVDAAFSPQLMITSDNVDNPPVTSFTDTLKSAPHHGGQPPVVIHTGSPAQRGPSAPALAGGVVLILGALGGALVLLRRRRAQ